MNFVEIFALNKYLSFHAGSQALTYPHVARFPWNHLELFMEFLKQKSVFKERLVLYLQSYFFLMDFGILQGSGFCLNDWQNSYQTDCPPLTCNVGHLSFRRNACIHFVQCGLSRTSLIRKTLKKMIGCSNITIILI